MRLQLGAGRPNGTASQRNSQTIVVYTAAGTDTTSKTIRMISRFICIS
jgi:hypothetical protein